MEDIYTQYTFSPVPFVDIMLDLPLQPTDLTTFARAINEGNLHMYHLSHRELALHHSVRGVGVISMDDWV